MSFRRLSYVPEEQATSPIRAAQSRLTFPSVTGAELTIDLGQIMNLLLVIIVFSMIIPIVQSFAKKQ
jgi:hypothetical protein